MTAQRTLTIYLIKSGCKAVGAIMRSGVAPLPVQIGGRHAADLYVRVSTPQAPDWVTFFNGAVVNLDNVQIMTSGAVLLVRTGERFFALTFGTGRALLQPNTIEERFGLKVTLNAVDPTQIRDVERLTVDSPAPHSQIQARGAIDIRDFGLNLDQDLLREVTGKPRDEQKFGRRLTGKDALHATGAFTLDEVPALLRRYLAESKKKDYRDHFPWVDHLQEVKNTNLKEELDEQVAHGIQQGGTSMIWLAVPEIIDWEGFDAFTYRESPNAERHADLDLATFLATTRDPTALTTAALKRHRVYAIDDTGATVGDWSVYQCLYAEMTRGTQQYLLNSGTWFIVQPAFHERIDTEFRAIPLRPAALPDAKRREIEKKYNRRVARLHPAVYALMDCKNITYQRGITPIELCDLYERQREFIHVKPYSGSSTLSHLFAQGVTSATLFSNEQAFRTAANGKLPATHQIANPAVPPPRGTYTVTYAIIKGGNDPFTIPFFSKVTLTIAAKTLRGLGYTPQLAKINRL